MQDPLVIVILMDYAYVNGGNAQVAITSAIGLRQAGHHPILFAPVGPVDDQLIQAGVETICIGQYDAPKHPSRISGMLQGFWNRDCAKALTSLLSRLPEGRTILHLHGWVNGLSPSVASAIRASRLPAVITLHDFSLFCPAFNLYNYHKGHACYLKPRSLACLATNCDTKGYARKLYRSATLLNARLVARLPEIFHDYILVSDFQKNIVKDYLPKDARVHRISNPITVPELGQKENPASGDIIFVGRLSQEKGPLIFAEAARRTGIKPVFIGDGPMAGIIQEKYPEASLLGWKSSSEVHALMRAARALVFPSLVYENQPLTVLEAKGLGTPVIVADQCAGREEIEDGVTGLWFESNKPDSLAHAIKKIMDDKLVRRLSANASNSFRAASQTLDHHIESITGIYRKILSSCPS